MTTPLPVLIVAEMDSSIGGDFIGEGRARLTAPQELLSAQSVGVKLEVSLQERYAAADIEFVIREIQAANILKEADDPNGPPMATLVFNDLPAYASMRARLEAPAFRFDQIDWVERDVEIGDGLWTWNIVPVPGVTGPQEVTVRIEANGILQAMLAANVLVLAAESVTETATVLPPTLVPPTPSPPAVTSTAVAVDTRLQ